MNLSIEGMNETFMTLSPTSFSLTYIRQDNTINYIVQPYYGGYTIIYQCSKWYISISSNEEKKEGVE